MLSNELVLDAFERIKDIVHKSVKGLSVDELTYRFNDSVNSIDWLIWHLTRIQDDHIADLTKNDQVWHEWHKRFSLPFDESETGYGHSSSEVAQVKADAQLLTDYHDAVYEATKKYINSLTDEDYHKVVDKRWDPPVTLAVRLISIISDDMQHSGQAAYIRGLLNK
jgi:uncharacterized damage-inducible protein DinB